MQATPEQKRRSFLFPKPGYTRKVRDPFLFWVAIGTAAWFLWFLVDCRLWMRFVHRSQKLDHEGKWDELEALIRRELRAFRPWIRLNIYFKSPGLREAIAALCLFQRGKLEESLRFAEEGARRSGRKPRTHADILKLQALEIGRAHV